MKHLLYLLVFFFLLPIAYSQETNLVYIENEFSLEHPNWLLDTSGQLGTTLILFSEKEGEKDKFIECVNVIVQDLKGKNIDLEKYKEISENQIKSMITKPKIYESKILDSKNQKYYKIKYAMSQGKLRLIITSVCYFRNDRAYLITFGAEFKKYKFFKPIGEFILNSFSFR